MSPSNLDTPRPVWVSQPDPRLARRLAFDRLARHVVRVGGFATVISILAILAFITIEVFPLWSSASLTPRPATSVATPVLAAGVEEYREISFALQPDGNLRFFRLAAGDEILRVPFPGLGEEPIVAVAQPAARSIVVVTATRLLAARILFDVERGSGARVSQPRVVAAGSWDLPPSLGRVRQVSVAEPEGGSLTAVVVDEAGAVRLFAVRETESFLGEVERDVSERPLELPAGARAQVVFVGTKGDYAVAGTDHGQLLRWDLRNPTQPTRTDEVQATASASVAVTAVTSLIGDKSLVVGDAAGAFAVWMRVRPEGDGPQRLTRIHEFEPHGAAVRAIAVSPRDRSFVTADDGGSVRLHHATTARTRVATTIPAPAQRLVFAPKADGLLAVTADGRWSHWDLDNAHPEASFTALFGKLWYEGYDQPEYVWQSTGGSDAFEPKLSLVPLMIGTMKGTLYALLFAVPLAVGAALYTSQFSHPRVRNTVKPVVEIMAALPSVVLGFLAGLWLAPQLETIIPAVFASALVVPVLVFAASLAWFAAPPAMRRELGPAAEVAILAVLVALGFQLSLAVNDWLQAAVFGGDFRAWLQAHGWRFDQRNNVVVGFAMGFAVIPIVFTISEDALSNVPRRLVSASLALGATRWQTALRVVLPTASPGIFSGVMIGFGRAVGETMIVLMATGNTPVLDWSIFTGMRTLSANIAVEIPEAPHGGTLYRVLFLAAGLLFVVTFIANTAAEMVRQRLRRRYQEL